MKTSLEDRLIDWTKEMREQKSHPLEQYSDKFSAISVALHRYSLQDVNPAIITSFLDIASELLRNVQRRLELILQNKMFEEYRSFHKRFLKWEVSYTKILDFFGEQYFTYRIDLYNYQLILLKCRKIFNGNYNEYKHITNQLRIIINSAHIEICRLSPDEAYYSGLVSVLIDTYYLLGETLTDLNKPWEAVASYDFVRMSALLLPDEELRYSVMYQVYESMIKASSLYVEMNYKDEGFCLFHLASKYKFDFSCQKYYIPTYSLLVRRGSQNEYF